MRKLFVYSNLLHALFLDRTANKAVETNEMWRIRQKEIELEDERRKRKPRDESSSSQMGRSGSLSKRKFDKRCSSGDEIKVTHASSSSSDKRWYSEDDEGLRDDEIESFLQSRNKRGRGSVGTRMDETGPYLPTEMVDKLRSCDDIGERKVVLGPERPPSLRQHSDDNERGRGIRKESMKKRSKKDKKGEKKRKRDRY
ncbi:unnamed protein product [Thlaspi arvense]|uniref:Uncharacterized protein n=1 Tax=Thlaspi arvense TaxID=13288 RepID=A0AAU9S3Y6_THLAR|nr:unnamed protein product [Thlaspi arvense]